MIALLNYRRCLYTKPVAQEERDVGDQEMDASFVTVEIIRTHLPLHAPMCARESCPRGY